MAKTWTPTEVKTKVAMLMQPGSPYVTNYPNVEELIRVNSVAEEWSDEILKGVIEKGPMYETLPKVCAEILTKREDERRWQVEQAHQAATTKALAEIKAAAEKEQRPHWSATWGFWVMVATFVVAAIAAWPVIQSWLK
jgi:citrate lyase beta subunit